MSRYKDVAAIGLAAMLSFGLVACGGGGGGGGGGGSEPAAEVETPVPDPAIAQRAAVEQAAATLSTATAGLSGEDVSQADVAAAMLAANGLDTALTAATDVPDTETAGYASQLTAAWSVISGAQARVTAAREAAEAEVARMAQVAKNEVSLEVAKAILAPHITLGDDTPFEFRVPTDVETSADTDLESVFAIERTSGSVDITLQQTEDEAEDKPYETSVVSIDDEWSGMGYTHTNTKGTQMENAVLYTDIEKAGHEKWSVYFSGADANTPGKSTLSADANGVVPLPENTVVGAEYLSASVLPGKPGDAQDEVGRDFAMGSVTNGTFYGVPGKFTCSTAACELTREIVDGMDEVTVSAVGALMFTPDVPSGKNFAAIADTVKVQYAVPDVDYVHFGYWMESTKQADGGYKQEIRTFSGNKIVPYADADGFPTLIGSATYSGLAAGRYVQKSAFDDEGDATIVTDGEFVASANLKAQFNNTDGKVAEANKWAITGTIANFMDDGEDLGWTLKLNKANLGTRDPGAGTITNPTSTFTGTTSGDAATLPGNWSGSMYGVDGGVDVTDGSDHPSSVAGEFNGHFVNGHVAGAFGANEDD